MHVKEKNMSKELATNYYEAIASKNITEVGNCLADTIALESGSLTTATRDQIVSGFQAIFDNVQTITVQHNEMTQENTVVACEVILQLDQQQLRLCDVLRFDEDGKISSIHSYEIQAPQQS